jgi:hypothetical protein
LQDQQQYLYAELIQVVEERGIAWLRPYILIEHQPEPASSSFLALPPAWVDLRQGPDLLLPTTLLRPALDTEVLPLLPLLADDRERDREQSVLSKTGQVDNGRRQLNQLIYRLWQADPTCFQTPLPRPV